MYHEKFYIYYKFVCIDETYAIIAEQQLLNTETNKIKAKRLGRAVVVLIDGDSIEQNELSEINYLLSSVRVHAMAYDDELSQYDRDEVNKVGKRRAFKIAYKSDNFVY